MMIETFLTMSLGHYGIWLIWLLAVTVMRVCHRAARPTRTIADMETPPDASHPAAPILQR